MELGEDISAFRSQVDAAIGGELTEENAHDFESGQYLGFNDFGSLETFRKTLKSWCQGSLDTARSSSTFTDATLVHTCLLATAGGTLSPFALLDLATLVRSIVLYDHVFYFQNPAIDDFILNERMGDRVLIPISRGIEWVDKDYTMNDLGLGIGELCCDAIRELAHLSRRDDGQALNEVASARKIWEALLEQPCPPAVMFHDVEDMWLPNFSPTYEYYSQWALLSAPSARWENVEPADVNSVANAVTDANGRSFVNLRIASLLEFPYTSSAFRAPFRRIRSSQALAAEEELRLVEVIKESVDKRAGARGSLAELPVFLAAVLSRISSLEQFWPAVGQLRVEAAGLRRRRGELEESLTDHGSKGQLRTEAQLSKAVTRESQTLISQLRVPVAGAAAAFVAAAISGPTAAALAAIGALSIWEKMDAATYELLVARFRRPHEIFLSHIGEEAAAMYRGLPRIARLWQLPEDSLDKHARFLKRIAALGLG